MQSSTGDCGVPLCRLSSFRMLYRRCNLVAVREKVQTDAIRGQASSMIMSSYGHFMSCHASFARRPFLFPSSKDEFETSRMCRARKNVRCSTDDEWLFPALDHLVDRRPVRGVKRHGGLSADRKIFPVNACLELCCVKLCY